MEIYIYFLLFLLFLLAIRIKNTTLIAFLLILLASIRSLSVGVDTNTYMENFQYDISSNSISQLLKKIEIGWLYLNLLVKEVFGDFRYLLFISSILTIIPINYAFNKGTNLPVLAYLFYFLLFYYFFSYSIIRQAIATSLFVLSIHFYGRKNFKKSIFFYGIGALIHYSVLALFPIVWLLNRYRISYRWRSIILIIAFCIGFSGVLDLARSYLALLPFEKYANYEFYKEGADFNRVSNYLFILPKIALLFYIYRISTNYNVIFEEIQINLLWFGLLVLSLFLSIPQVSRFTIYLTIFEVIIMVNVISSLPNKKRFESAIVFSAYCIMYFIYYSFTNRFGVIPFDFKF